MPVSSAFFIGRDYRTNQNNLDADQEVPGCRRRGAVDGGSKSDDRFVPTADERPNYLDTPR
jgi:hypothetical protein